jgi:hypothetical protein
VEQSVRDLLAAFDALPPGEQQEFAKEVLRRASLDGAIEDAKPAESLTIVSVAPTDPGSTEGRSLFGRSIGPMLWLAGLALIIYCAPAGYRALRLDEKDYVAGFLGTSHELVVVSGMMKAKDVLSSMKGTGLRSAQAQLRAAQLAQMQSRTSTSGLVSIHLLHAGSCVRRNLELDFLLRPKTGFLEITGVTPCLEANLLCIETEFGPFAMVDPQTGDSVLTVSGIWSGFDGSHHHWGIEARGTRLAYVGQGMGDAICVDVRNDQELYKYEGPSFLQMFGGRRHAQGVLISPDGKYMEIDTGPFDRPYIIDIDRRRPKDDLFANWNSLTHHNLGRLLAGTQSMFAQREIAESFAPEGDMFIDRHGQVWDLKSESEICSVTGPCVFADGGKKLLWLEPARGGTKLVWYDSQAKRELTDQPTWISQNVASVDNLDGTGHLIRIDARREPPELSWYEKWLGKIGIRLTPKSQHQWFLIDGRTRAIVTRGADDLLAVSRDGRYAVTTDEDENRLKIYELPLRRSVLFMSVAGGAWTMLAAIVWTWRRRKRRMKDEG